MALGALGRQIAKKPNFFMGLRKCPNCKDFVININKYCPKCGQALLWDGDVE
jgi:predicted amidophosphoribosyltransferase